MLILLFLSTKVYNDQAQVGQPTRYWLNPCTWTLALFVVFIEETAHPCCDMCSHAWMFFLSWVYSCVIWLHSAYEQKRAAGGAKSSCPGTPVSPMQQHYSPKPATAGRPDAGYMNPGATSQPLPSNSYPMNARWHGTEILPLGILDIMLISPDECILNCLISFPSSRFQGPSGDPMCPQFPQPAQAFQRMPSAPAGHCTTGGGGGGGGGPGGGGGVGYHRQHSDPCMPYLQQSFKQEYMDPLYERAAHMAGPGHVSGQGHGHGHGHNHGHGPHQHPQLHSHPHRFPPAHMMVKQEPTDYTYEPGEQ